MTENPYDDPEVADFMRQHGIVHKPGMAQEVLSEIAPLLAAEGIDLDDPEGAPSIEELNAAFGRAIEQRNMQIMNPVSTERDLTLDFLLEVTELLAAGNLRKAERVVDSIEPEPTDTRPPASHVIGVCLGLLDRWHTDAILGESLSDTRIPKWRGPAKSTARRLLVLARRGEAYSSLDSLLIQHGGEFVMHSAILAVAGTVMAHAAATNATIPEAATGLFTHEGTRAGSGAAFGIAAEPVSAAHAQYEEWLRSDPENTDDEIEEVMDVFSSLTLVAANAGLDIDDPTMIEDLIEDLFEISDEDVVFALLNHLDRYVHFRLESGADGWDAAHEEIEDAMDELHPEMQVLGLAMTTSQQIPDADRLTALRNTPAISGSARLLDWIGGSRRVTQTGNLRRADIAPAARFFDLYVEGVAKLPPPVVTDSPFRRGEHPDEVLYVQSMGAVPLLGPVWEALQVHQVLRVNSSSARPGPQLEKYFGEGTETNTLEIFAASIIMEILTWPMQQDDWYRLPVIDVTIGVLLEALDPEGREFITPDHPLSSNFLLHELITAGFVSRAEDGTITIPAALQAPVSVGMMMAMRYLTETRDEEYL